VRNAFLSLGHTAYSNDILPAEDNSPNHIQGDVTKAIKSRTWDLIILHPPCTYLTSSGLHWNKRRPERAVLTEEAITWTAELWNLALEHSARVALENPIGCLSTRWMKPTQIIQPWMFGHPESKATCLWLHNLPKLSSTNELAKPAGGRWQNQTASGQNKLPPSKDRWKLRSKTYQGVADAMALQWGGLNARTSSLRAGTLDHGSYAL
jgi:hypothetical protein